MSVEANKDLVRKFYAALQREDYVAAAELCHPNFVFYTQVDTPIYGTDGFVQSEKKNFDAFKGFRFPIEALLAEGDQVAAYLTFEGKQSGPIEGVEPTGKTVHFSLMMLLKVADGKIIEKRAHFDRFDIRRQLGAQV
ncbi:MULTISPECIES: ester cyclase [Paraburkholderia]|uniref:ester cyclase n=1 Tax=Paraburkholderia TaxID=1822464 RepID=UPI002AAF4A24|nr:MULTISPECIES: ester cyclase [Paraburkholderia]